MAAARIVPETRSTGARATSAIHLGACTLMPLQPCRLRVEQN
jgi:hypothetical protein